MSPLLTPTMPPTDPAHPPPLTRDQFPPTLLLRVYGPSSDSLISRTEELRILHVLSGAYGLGPKLTAPSSTAAWNSFSRHER